MKKMDARVEPAHDSGAVIPGRAIFGASPESITTVRDYGFRACAPSGGASRN